MSFNPPATPAPTPSKSNKVFPLHVDEQDILNVDEIRGRPTFPPKRSSMGRALLRYAVYSVLHGHVSLEQVSEIDRIGPVVLRRER